MARTTADQIGPSLTPPRTGDAQLLLDQAVRAERQGQRALARQLYEQVLWASPETITAERCSAALLGTARTYQSEGQTDAALECLEAAQQVAEINGAVGALGAALNARAVLEWQRGALDEAERLYIAA